MSAVPPRGKRNQYPPWFPAVLILAVFLLLLFMAPRDTTRAYVISYSDFKTWAGEGRL